MANDKRIDINLSPVPDDNPLLFFQRYFKLMEVALPAKRHLAPREAECLANILCARDSAGSLTEFSRGPYRIRLQEKMGLSKSNYTNLLTGLVKKRWLNRDFDDDIYMYHYRIPRELLRLSNAYFSGRYESVRVTVELLIDAQ